MRGNEHNNDRKHRYKMCLCVLRFDGVSKILGRADFVVVSIDTVFGLFLLWYNRKERR